MARARARGVPAVDVHLVCTLLPTAHLHAWYDDTRIVASHPEHDPMA